MDEDDQEENEVWKEYTENEVSGRLCAQYLKKVMPVILERRDLKSKNDKESEFKKLLEVA